MFDSLMLCNGQLRFSMTFFVYVRTIFFVQAFLCARHDRVSLLNVQYCTMMRVLGTSKLFLGLRRHS